MSTRWTVVYGDLLVGRDAIDIGGDPFDAVLCDPPYELGFMSKKWDRSGVAFDPATWAWVLGHLRPGAHMLAFGGTRTFHRMICAIEDGGFEIRDCMCWLYGSGFPKSLDVGKAIDAAAGAERPVVGTAADFARDGADRATNGSHVVPHEQQGGHGYGDRWSVPVTAPKTEAAKTWDGYGTALKPAWEPIVIARVPLAGTVAENVQAHGAGALAIDACRIEGSIKQATAGKRTGSWGIGAGDCTYEKGTGAVFTNEGRWPSNVLLDEEAAQQLDAQTGVLTSGFSAGFVGEVETSHAMGAKRRLINQDVVYADSGGASRFFYTSKVSTSERNDGLDDIPYGSETAIHKNEHPTLKPVALTEYLAKLLLPPRGIGRPRRILVPFSGAGSEMIGALRAGWDEVVGIENDDDYVKLSRLRLSRVDTSHQVSLFEGFA